MRRIALITAVAATALAGCASAGGGTTSGTGSGTAGGQPSAAPATSQPAGIVTEAIASQVFSRYVSVNNQGNKSRQDSQLATYEGGSSYQIDAGTFRWTLKSDPANKDYFPQSFTGEQFFIPRQTSYPAWFAARVTQHNATTGKVTGQVYFVFTKASASAGWLDVREPATWDMPATAPQPQIATSGGYATPVSPDDASGLAVAPDKLPAQDVAYLDVDNIPTTPPRPGMAVPKRPKVVNFTNGKTGLNDLSDLAFWKKDMMSGGSVIDMHQTTGDQVYALRTTSGGVLVFYDLTAGLSLTGPYAQPFTIGVSGFFNNDKPASTFTLNYVEQYAVYEPPGTAESPQVLGDVAAMVSGDCDETPCT